MRGDTRESLIESYNRWRVQHSKLVEALKEYDAALTDYLVALKGPVEQTLRRAATPSMDVFS